MKKLFISSGELSGDRIGAWYLNKQKNVYCEAVGGSFLKDSGAKLFETIDKLSIVGVVEIIKHIPFILKFLNKVSKYIINNNFDEVVLVDFPGFNLLLAKRLKKLKPDLKIIYLSPPQLWVWGAWRVKKLKKYCDQVIVLYPFEVEWYAKRGVNATWLGYPFYNELQPYFELAKSKSNTVAIMPGSRASEIKNLFPYFAHIIKLLKEKNPEINFVLPLSESFSKKFMVSVLKQNGLTNYQDYIKIVTGKDEKLKELSKCCLAISKPGTVTLQVALLKVPTIILYKAPKLTYLIAKSLVAVEYMGLANLLLKQNINPEFIQDECKPEIIAGEAAKIYNEFKSGDIAYNKRLQILSELQFMLNK